jgi:uracil-DNA glycosylase
VPKLRDSFRDFLVNWRDDLDSNWRSMLDGVEPAVNGILESLTIEANERIFPGRKGQPVPAARADAHVFRAFDGLQPEDVRAVILGQDPYPKASRATGRSFEQGDLADWSPNRNLVAESLRRIIQVVANFRTGKSDYLQGDAVWPVLVGDNHTDGLNIAPPRDFFDRWQHLGVLCLNASFTLSRFEPSVQQAHFALWRPVVKTILTALATRPHGSIAFILWGSVAQNTFEQLSILDAAVAAGTRDRVALVTHVHPGAEDASGQPRFFRPPNTFTDANQKLAAAGGTSIQW